MFLGVGLGARGLFFVSLDQFIEMALLAIAQAAAADCDRSACRAQNISGSRTRPVHRGGRHFFLRLTARDGRRDRSVGGSGSAAARAKKLQLLGHDLQLLLDETVDPLGQIESRAITQRRKGSGKARRGRFGRARHWRSLNRSRARGGCARELIRRNFSRPDKPSPPRWKAVPP